jgi:hypothetical protein
MILKFQRPWNFTFDLECPQGSNDFKNPEPVEFHIELEWPQGSDDIQEDAQIRIPMELQTFRYEVEPRPGAIPFVLIPPFY